MAALPVPREAMDVALAGSIEVPAIGCPPQSACRAREAASDGRDRQAQRRLADGGGGGRGSRRIQGDYGEGWDATAAIVVIVAATEWATMGVQGLLFLVNFILIQLWLQL